MNRIGTMLALIASLSFATCRQSTTVPDDFWKLANEKKQHLRLSTYITAHTVEQLFTSEAGRREVLSLLHCYGITKVYFEVYRSGLVIPPELIKESVFFLKENGFEVTGGIATVPGDGFGMKQEGPLEWFNWQNAKTSADLKKVIEESAPFFDSFIVDDFLCTSDTSMESKATKGDRSWSVYRRGLLTDIASNVIINPAKQKNPHIRVIIKYPQWYDRFHLFGYDVDKESKLFDGIWVGTETRGQYTQRFGFVQPYEGFVNFRWLSSVAGPKTGGAWFDHEDCTGQDFLDQAYQSVLAGAKEIIIFSFDSFVTGHPGHHLLMHDFNELAKLAEYVKAHPVTGVAGYKPPNSDAGGDLYLMDYIGMLGVSLVPESSYPAGAKTIFLPAQAAADSGIYPLIKKSLEEGAKIIMTTGFIARAAYKEKIAALARIKWPLPAISGESEIVIADGSAVKLKLPLRTDFRLIPDGADVLLQLGGKENLPFMVANREGNIYVINTHTFSQADFDAVGEVLLCPRQTGLLELPESWTNTIRKAFASGEDPRIEGPGRITVQKLTGGDMVIQNYNQDDRNVRIEFSDERNFTDGFSGEKISTSGKVLNLNMKQGSRIWLRKL
jgi:hypothetical protein